MSLNANNKTINTSNLEFYNVADWKTELISVLIPEMYLLRSEMTVEMNITCSLFDLIASQGEFFESARGHHYV